MDVKGGYTYLDLRTVELGSSAVITGVYQKVKDTYGKPVIVILNNDGEAMYILTIAAALNDSGASIPIQLYDGEGGVAIGDVNIVASTDTVGITIFE